MKSLTAFISGEDRTDRVQLTIENDGVLIKKTVSAEDFLDILSGNLDKSKTGENRSLGGLPKNTVDCYVNDKNENSFGAVIYSPGVRRYAFFKERDTNESRVYEIPYPNLCFVFKVLDGIARGYCYAMTDDELTLDTELYLFPFSNVSPSGGNICFGSNRTKVEKIKALEEIINLFFSAAYNGDYYNRSSSTLANLDLEELFKHISTGEKFPVEILISTGKTLRQMLEGIGYTK